MMNMPRMLGYLFGGLYAWFVTVYFGAVLLDIAYAKLLDRATGSDVQPVFREVSDLLLLIGTAVLFCGLLAIAASWRASAARNLFGTSLLLIAGAGFLAAIFLFPLFRVSPELPVFEYTWLLRLVPIGLGSLLALLGFRSLFKEPVSLLRP